ncbi:MAG: CBS domain-containing protein [Candidatus Zixiibacteriota bacterium]
MLVKYLLENKSKEIVSIKSSTTIGEAIELLLNKNISSLLVMDNSRLKGIISDKDILRAVHESKGDFKAIPVEDIMTTNLFTGKPEDDISDIAEMMTKHWIRHVPIVDNNNLVGLLSSRDINHTLIRNQEVENMFLQQHMDGIHMRDKSGDM